MGFWRDRWEDLRGNLLWQVFVWIFGGSLVAAIAQAVRTFHNHPLEWRFVGVVFVISVLALAVIFLLAARYRPRGNQPISGVVPQSLAAVISQFDKIADDDATRMSQRIVFIKSYPRPHLDLPDPYIDLQITLVNASVFRVASEGIDGFTTYRNQPLPAHAQVVNPPFILLHAAVGDLTIRQFISNELAHNISTARGKVAFDFGHSSITFMFIDRGGQTKRFSRSFGEIEIANRD